ncbi:hypothetical protein L9S41_11935 [Geoalkalibacter halelectricus]|uniref:Uncharacterized protein n=1 Tax=Geoalkalibacter halelectricus TaxID=2847045 RepID=A0ABY5ZKE7_9BACT|nr:hypothetical protein [Geoalkalibacter halelectricus]MDO3378101.1 hypothetical protein [Geoalkalibacter halelectricus]UWZ78395.1 hypothetical protein L9S41_11935 [Geoalkalibacter halelectricus]
MQYIVFPLGLFLLIWWFTPLGFFSSFVLGGVIGVMICASPQTAVGVVVCVAAYIFYIIIGFLLY